MPRALLSVYDKTGLVEFAQTLQRCGYELLASGGTASALTEAGIPSISVDSVTQFPEMLDGRVKTLHPLIFGGLLGDRDRPQHVEQMAEHGIAPIDLLVSNLYPFASNPSVELIDVGGPSMIRAAAKNFAHVAVVVHPDDYARVADEIEVSGGHVGVATRRRLAATAFAHLVAYDTAIAAWLDAATDEITAAPGDPIEAVSVGATLPPTIGLSLELAQTLRYGENPHQTGARYRIAGTASWWDSAVQLGGKELSYLNVYDADAAWRLVHDLGDDPAAVVVKHANPCGAAVGPDIATAYRAAHEGDPVAAFGGVVAVNRKVTPEMAEALAPVFTEVLVAPSFSPGALTILQARKALRLIEGRPPVRDELHLRSISGGLLVQETDDPGADNEESGDWRVVGDVVPSEAQWRDLRFAWRLCAHVSSNAIVVVSHGQAVGIGAGQQSRVDAATIAVTKAGDRARTAVAASDAFFPFRDGVDVLAAAGVAAVVEPGGSVRDDEVIAAANAHGMAIVLTGRRHFRH